MCTYRKLDMASKFNVDSSQFVGVEEDNDLIIVESDEDPGDSPAVAPSTSWERQTRSYKHKADNDDRMEEGKKRAKNTDSTSGVTSSGDLLEASSVDNVDTQCKFVDEEGSVPNLASRWPHNPQPQAMRSSLLEKVLNQKKMVLMQSPEVINWLQESQAVVEENFQNATHPKPQEKGSKPRSGRASQSQGGQSTRDEAAEGLNTSETSTKSQQRHKADTGRGDKAIVTHSIWSREASAFSSVSRTNQPK